METPEMDDIPHMKRIIAIVLICATAAIAAPAKKAKKINYKKQYITKPYKNKKASKKQSIQVKPAGH
jgi:hypothetical protein